MSVGLGDVSGTLRYSVRVALALTLIATAWAATLAVPAIGKGTIPGHYIVVLKDSVEHPGVVATRHAENRDADVSLIYRNALKGYAATLAPNEMKAVAKDPQVAYIEPDALGGVASQTIPTGISRTYSGHTINEVDDVRVDADVAILDTGITKHSDLNLVSQVDCLGGTPPTCVEGGSDFFGHGTHVAGTVGALDNGYGVVGVAPGARLWSVKVIDDQGEGTLSQFIAGLDWVTARAGQIEVVNASLHLGSPNKAFSDALDASIDAGIVNVTAAGNFAKTVDEIPAFDPDEITVSAIGDFDGVAGAEKDWLAWFSNFGPDVDIAAPGMDIRSTAPGDTYGLLSGTSMAAPHVAGAAAIFASVNNPESREDVEEIRDTLVERGNLNWEDAADGFHEPLLDMIDNVANPLRPGTSVNAATGVSAHGVTLSGAVNPKGYATSYRFEIGYPPNILSVPSEFKAIGSGTSDVNVSNEVSGLEPSTTYYFRVFAVRTVGFVPVGASKYRSFTTLPAAPSVTTEAATGVGKTVATLNAKVDPEGAATTYQFEYGPTTSYGTKAPIPAASAGSGTSSVAVSKAISGLTGATTYHYRIAATNSVGTSYGADKTLTTVKPAMAITGLVTEVTASTATLRAEVNPEGTPASYVFGYGKTGGPPYSFSVPASPVSIGSGTSYVQVSQPITGLTKGTTYHFSVFAINEKGAIYGADRTFTTKPDGWKNEAAAPDVYGKVNGLSCSSATACTSVQAEGVVKRWNGSSWATQTLQKPAGAVWVKSESVSCPTATFCMETGTSYDGSKVVENTQRWNGTAWASVTPNKEIVDIACTSATACIGVGNLNIMSWNGTAWSGPSVPNLDAAGYHSGNLTDVFCSAGNFCMAVGSATEGPFSLRWDGTKWTVEAMPAGGTLKDVSCASAQECFAVGWQKGVKNLFLRWDGESWKTQVVPTYKNVFGETVIGTMHSVSCTPAGFCVATGPVDLEYAPGDSKYWAGGEWLPLTTNRNTLSGVSCVTGKCIAVGSQNEVVGTYGLVAG